MGCARSLLKATMGGAVEASGGDIYRERMTAGLCRAPILSLFGAAGRARTELRRQPRLWIKALTVRHIDGQPPQRSLFVFFVHIPSGLAHGLDADIQTDKMVAVAA
jgi:hypothetical protein